MAATSEAIEILKFEFEARKRKNSRYSLRAFAKYLGVSHTVLSLIITGKRSLSQKAALLFVDRLGLSAEQSKIIMNASTRAIKKAGKVGYQNLTLEKFNLISDWVYYAILSLFNIPDAKFDPEWIAARLNISESRAEDALARLLALELIEKVQGQWRQSGKPLKIENAVSTSATKTFNKNLLSKAIESLEQDPLDLRNLSSTTFALDPAQLPFAVGKIREFRRKLTADLEKKGKPREVYSLTVQLFPLTKEA